MSNIAILISVGALGLLLLWAFLYSVINNAVKDGVVKALIEYDKHKNDDSKS